MTTIALDARLTRQMSVGMKAYVTELVARLPDIAPDLNFEVFSNERLAVPQPNARYREVEQRVATNGGVGEQFFYPRQLARSEAALIHYMSVYAPRRSSRPHVYTIHDLIHLRFPQYFSWKVPPYYRLIARPVARTARAVITDARATVTDLHTLLGVDAEKVRVIPLGVDPAFFVDESERPALAARARKRFDLSKPYIVYAGNHRPHKNLATLVEGWRRSAIACDLILTEEGDFGFSLERGAKTNGNIVQVGRVSREELIALYAGCGAAVQPSLYEGFGLGALEAMAAGAPVIVAQTPALLELAQNAAPGFPPKDAAALAALIDRLLGDEGTASSFARAGRKRAEEFTWDRTARSTAAAYREALQ